MPNTGTGDVPGIDKITDDLYGYYLGLMDQTANTDLANSQISQLSTILNQQSNLAGKDLAAQSFAQGSATPANISGILQGKQKALTSGVTEIQAAAQARADANIIAGLEGLAGLRAQLSAEKQAELDRALAKATLAWQKEIDMLEYELSQDELDASYWSMITKTVLAVVGVVAAPYTGGWSLALTGAAVTVDPDD